MITNINIVEISAHRLMYLAINSPPLLSEHAQETKKAKPCFHTPQNHHHETVKLPASITNGSTNSTYIKALLYSRKPILKIDSFRFEI